MIFSKKTAFEWFLILPCVLMALAVDASAQTFSTEADKADPYSIGCLLPLTGKQSANGNRAAEAMILALDFFGAGVNSPFKLYIEDTASEAAGVRAAVARLAGKHKVVAIIGLLNADEAPEAAQEAQRLDVPIIVLAIKEGITDIGDNVFQLTLTPQKQVQALVEYVMLDLAMKDFAVLYPDDPYGKEMVALFRYEVEKHKGTIKRIQSYGKDQTDFGEDIKTIAVARKAPPRGRKHTRRIHPEDEDYYPVIDFDALFIPDVYSRVRMIASQLAFYNVRGIKLLGTNLWNHPDVSREGSDELNDSAADISLADAIFMDNFTTNSFIPEAVQFTDLFFTAFGRNPGTLEAMVYDAAKISRSIVQNYHIESRRAFRERLASLRSYRGATGKTSFADSRLAEKQLFTLTIKDGQIIQTK
jgi:branched-chain amino acid transport system substrate-binding protein